MARVNSLRSVQCWEGRICVAGNKFFSVEVGVMDGASGDKGNNELRWSAMKCVLAAYSPNSTCAICCEFAVDLLYSSSF